MYYCWILRDLLCLSLMNILIFIHVLNRIFRYRHHSYTKNCLINNYILKTKLLLNITDNYYVEFHKTD